MRHTRGFTLIEAMVTVAVLGIVTVGLLQAGTAARLRAHERLEQERASQVLELEADALARGVPADAAVARALLAELPAASLEKVPQGRLATVRVTWGHGRRTSRELTVFTKGAR